MSEQTLLQALVEAEHAAVYGYGVLGGFGLGMAYIVPIAMLQKWFPDKRGLITGLAVATGLGVFYAEWVAGS